MIFEMFGNWIEKTNRFVRRVLKLGPTEKELQQFFDEWDRDTRAYKAEQERDWQEYLTAERAREEEYRKELDDWEELEREIERDRLEGYARQPEPYEQQEMDSEWEEAHDLSTCRLCGSPRRFGRCPACDHAFGRD